MPDYSKLTPYLKDYMEFMGWDDLNWLEDVHMGYEEGEAAIFDRNVNGWVRIPSSVKLPKNQQDRDMIARELSGQVPDVARPPAGAAQQGLPEVLKLRHSPHVVTPGLDPGAFFSARSVSAIIGICKEWGDATLVRRTKEETAGASCQMATSF